MGVESFFANRGGFFATRLELLTQTAVRWSHGSVPWPLTLGTACCSLELDAVTGSGAGKSESVFPVTSPRQADLLVVAGSVTWKMAPVLRRVYEQMLEPKRVIAFGVCAASGGMYQNYAVVPGVDRILPVDVYVPGCPPRAEALLDALNQLSSKIAAEGSGAARYKRSTSKAHRPTKGPLS